MISIYAVDVELRGHHHRTVRVAASSPILACESAECIAARAYDGDLGRVHLFFANRVQELDGFDMLDLMARQMG